jgi:hypothetical protein
VNPVGEEFLNVPQLSQSFGHCFSILFIHKRIGVAIAHETAVKMGDISRLQLTNNEFCVAAAFFGHNNNSRDTTGAQIQQ